MSLFTERLLGRKRPSLEDFDARYACLQARFGSAAHGRFIVSCPHSSEEECSCIGGETFAVCEQCEDEYADEDAGGRLLCSRCFADGAVAYEVNPDAEPTRQIPHEEMSELVDEPSDVYLIIDNRRPPKPSDDELDAELLQHAEAGR